MPTECTAHSATLHSTFLSAVSKSNNTAIYTAVNRTHLTAIKDTLRAT